MVAFFSDKVTVLRITLSILWLVILTMTIAASTADIEMAWPYIGVGMAFFLYWFCFLLRNSAAFNKGILFILPVFLVIGIAVNSYLSIKYVDEHLLYERKTGDRRIYWFERYARRNARPVENAEFYLPLRRLAGSSIVIAGKSPLRAYDVINMAHLKKMTLGKYNSSLRNGLRAAKLAQNYPGLSEEVITMVEVLNPDVPKIVFRRIPFDIYYWADGREDTYFLYRFQFIEEGTGVIPGYTLVPQVVHLALSSQTPDRTMP